VSPPLPSLRSLIPSPLPSPSISIVPYLTLPYPSSSSSSSHSLVLSLFFSLSLSLLPPLSQVCSRCGSGDRTVTIMTSLASRLDHCQACGVVLCGACSRRSFFPLPPGSRQAFDLCQSVCRSVQSFCSSFIYLFIYLSILFSFTSSFSLRITYMSSPPFLPHSPPPFR
jgi:hypothetical protein